MSASPPRNPENSQPYRRIPYLVVNRERSARKDVYGSIDDHVVRHAQLLRPEEDSSTVIVGMHPVGSPGYLPAFSSLARAGHHVIACASRYSMGDAALQMENVLLDLAACVRDAKERLGYRRVVLAGWSGGGALLAGYQAEAEKRTITATAAGEYSALADTELVPGDGLVLMAAHRSRHRLLTDFLDASIVDEDNPTRRDPELDLYSTDARHRPPYSAEFLARYRQAQRERNERITARVVDRLAELERLGRGDEEECFVVHGTMADPRWLDPAVDPNDRKPGWSYLGDPRLANNGPAGLARFTTLRGWLSQWSLSRAQVDAVDSADRISVPVLVVVNSADDACPNSHPHDFFRAVRHDRKQLHTITGANHYFTGDGSREHLSTSSALFAAWARDHHLLES
ncbi:alpha/beta fold hydrolase [Pseudonocardia halophobica]|uniref:Alpha/beta hydrolase n=1 Tax=Pseudonocardia halophobica TaxID=29401 RepID=A0A9W6L056_9PSEU|nr:alpha/beta hydrolase [Pseudonocardia halophobica]GLL09756.1 alpha/beta hydrolase [Pseudonocardia halophobica]